jgi:hypothetical protein
MDVKVDITLAIDTLSCLQVTGGINSHIYCFVLSKYHEGLFSELGAYEH